MRMKTFTKAVALVVVMALMFAMTAIAAPATALSNVDVIINYDTGAVKITATHPEGTEADGDVVNLVVGTSAGSDAYWNDVVVENGKITVEFTMDDAEASGDYVVKFGGETVAYSAEDAYSFVSGTDAKTFIETVNPMDAATLKAYLENPLNETYDVNCDVSVPGASDYEKVAAKTEIMELMAEVDYDTTEGSNQGYYDFLSRFNTAVIISLIKEEKVTDIVDNYKNVFGFNLVETGKADWFGWYRDTLSASKYDAVEDALLSLGEDFELDDKAGVKDVFEEAVALALFNDITQATKANIADYAYAINLEGATNIDMEAFEDLDDDEKESVLDAIASRKYAANKRSYADLDDVENAFVAAIAAAIAEKEEKEDDFNSGYTPGGSKQEIEFTPVVPQPEFNMFDDIADVEWAKTAINELAKKGIVNGVADRTFAPNDVLTREQFVKILVGALDIKASGNTPFADVVASEWYANFVAIAYNSGIVNGTSDTEFGVGDSLTREQLCTMVYRAIKASGIELKMVNTSASFVDSAEISDWAKEAVDYLYKAGVVNGVGGNAFDPQGTTTRAMGAKVIYGVLEGGVK